MTSQQDVLRAAEIFTGFTPSTINLGQEVTISGYTAIVASYLVDKHLSELQIQIKELNDQLNHGVAINPMIATENLKRARAIVFMLENNCSKSLHTIVQEFQKQR
ncbi:MAG TPA: hypothetical protein VJH89_03435 [Patescibacteria group bacterium]|nr:hypothetical protein [Patescibacteria group bacterium]